MVGWLELIAAGKKLPDVVKPLAVVATLLKRFPDYRCPPELMRRLLRRNPGVGAAALATWSEDFSSAELRRAFSSADPREVDDGLMIARQLAGRGFRVPTDLCGALLRDERVTLRLAGAQLAASAVEIDVERVREIAAHDADARVRNAAVQALCNMVGGGRARADDIAGTVLNALHDEDDEVQSIARSNLHVVGPRGVPVALELLRRDGEVNEADSLVEAAVAGGRAGEVLDLRLGLQVADLVARNLVKLSQKRPELLKDALGRLDEMCAVSGDATGELLGTVVKVVGPGAVAPRALARNLDAGVRLAALDALLSEPTAWQDGYDLARRIAGDRSERGGLRVEAINRLQSGVPEDRQDEVLASTRRFLENLARDEPNERIRAMIAQRLKE